MHSNNYTFLYAIGLSIITAIILVFTAENLKPLQEANIALDKKKSILKSLQIENEDNNEIERIYGESVKEFVVNSKGDVLDTEDIKNIEIKKESKKPVEEQKLPVYVFKDKEGNENYVMSVYGVGLWGPIWGYVSLDKDFKTIKGAYFDHKGETPGLGAEIATKAFQDQFIGKSIYDSQDKFVSINVMKKSTKSDIEAANRVDGISGGTITSDGTDEMLKTGIKPYLGYFSTLKNQ